MAYEPIFSISPTLLMRVESIASLRERIRGAAIHVAWIPALQKDTRARNAHSSTAIEGNPLTLEQVRAVEADPDAVTLTERPRREVVNYFAALRHVEKHATKKKLAHQDVLRLHAIVGGGVMDQGEAGRYRTIGVRVGRYVPPAPREVSGLMFELLEWWNKDTASLSPVLSSAILHYRFEAIHPFSDGNGRAGRLLAIWELYRRGFDVHHIFSIDEFYWEDRPRYYSALQTAREDGENLTSWLEYTAEGVNATLERTWTRIQRLLVSKGREPVVLRPKQEQLLQLLRVRGSLSPREIWDGIGISRQGAMDLLRPLMKAGLVKRVGTLKTGRYMLE
jgi:Fic family protein